MKFMVLVLALGYVTTTEGSLHELPVHPGVGGLYRGPNSETIIKGPDGSVITAEAEGGAIHIQETLEPIVAAELAVQPDVVSVSVAPTVDVSAAAIPAVVAPAVPLLHTIEIVQPDPHIIETEIVDAPVLEPQQSSDLIGPSGSISIRGSSSVVSGPASTTISEPARVLVAAPVVGAVPVVASVTTPLLAAPVADIIPDSIGTASILAQPPIISASISPISTISPPTAWDSGRIFSSTIAPPIIRDLELNHQIYPQLTLSTPAPIAILNQQEGFNSHLLSANSAYLEETQHSLGPHGEIVNIDQPAALIEPASSYGVINNIGNTVQISSTIRPELSASSTLVPLTVPSQELLPPRVFQVNNDRQLSINPSLIPSANIIPPELGPLPASTIDLGTTVAVSSTPRAPGLYSPTELPNIQRPSEEDSVIVDNNIKNTDERLSQSDGRLGQFVDSQQISIQNLEVNSGTNVPLLRNTVPTQNGISQNGLIGAQLTKYGIDASQINLSNVPLSSATPLSDNSHVPFGIPQSIEDPSSVLWNRYGRDVNKEN